jgi:hypothetical protein
MSSYRWNPSRLLQSLRKDKKNLSSIRFQFSRYNNSNSRLFKLRHSNKFVSSSNNNNNNSSSSSSSSSNSNSNSLSNRPNSQFVNNSNNWLNPSPVSNYSKYDFEI